MRNSTIRWLTPAALALLLVASGCETSPTQVNEDMAALQSLIEAEVDYFTADLFSGQGATDPTTPAKVLADIVPWRYGRQILGVERDISIDIDNTTQPATAEVTWTAEITGAFHVIDTQANAYSKDYIDNLIRYATFERRGGTNTQHRGWRMTSVSGTEIVSEGATVGIASVNMTSTDGVDTTFTNVSELKERDLLLVFTPLDTVTLTVTTGNTDDIVLLHYPAWMASHNTRHFARRRLINNGDGTYTGHWVTRGLVWRNRQLRNPPRHITIDVLSHGTVFTDDQPYDSVAWGFVYRVQP